MKLNKEGINLTFSIPIFLLITGLLLVVAFTVNENREEFTNEEIYAEELNQGDVIDGGEVTFIQTVPFESIDLSIKNDYTVEAEIFYDELMDTISYRYLDKSETSNILFKFETENEEPFKIKPPYTGVNTLSEDNISFISNYLKEDVENLLKEENAEITLKFEADKYSFSAVANSEAYGNLSISKILEFKLVEVPMEALNYNQFNSQEVIEFDLNNDSLKEKIEYNSEEGKLSVQGYGNIPLDLIFSEKDYFIIVTLGDKNFIGIIDYGPSEDYTTYLYALLDNEKISEVGKVPGILTDTSNYTENGDDFNSKSIIMGELIEAPVRLSLLPQTWWGRNIFYFDRDIKEFVELKDNFYRTDITLNLKEDLKAYTSPDIESSTTQLKGDQEIEVLYTDNKKWIAIRQTDINNLLWINLDNYNSDYFSGFKEWD